jgi:predicted DNA-binding transcriptional regulator AlpA
VTTTIALRGDIPVANPSMRDAPTTRTPLLLDVKACATLLSISPRSWQRLVERGEAPMRVKVGNLTRWRASEVEAFVAALGTERRAA